MKKFLKSLGQLNELQIDTVIAVVNQAISEFPAHGETENPIVSLVTSNESLIIQAQAVNVGCEVAVNIQVDNEDVDTVIHFVYNTEVDYFSAIAMHEIPKPKPVLMPLLFFLSGGLSNPQQN